jgi:serine phosphatase RsbU (regulator of sigma subunit)
VNSVNPAQDLMEDVSIRIGRALANEEARAEQFASTVRFILLFVLTSVALLNVLSVSFQANVLNGAALVVGYLYGFIVLIRIRQTGYRPAMKYITSCLDVVLVFLLLFMYVSIDIPSVALKNYVFLVVFPLIALTAFRYDRTLTLVAGGLAITLYLGMVLYLTLFRGVELTHGGYAEELFSRDVTYVGQLTKVLILAGYVVLLAYLAQYSRRLFAKLIGDELNLRHEKELMDWEMKIASGVQTQFLPNTVPEVSGLEMYGAVQQGKFVGGDYYDFIRLEDGELLVVAADVSGKGVPAALIMAEVRASTQLLASMPIGLEDLAQRLNSLLHQSTDKKSFVTFFAAKIDPKQHRLTYINAGHPMPLIYSNSGVRTLAKGTIPLGVSATLPQLETKIEELLPGDLFVCYTDGIVERMNPLGEQYGEERLLDYLRTNGQVGVQAFTQRLFEEVRKFGEGKELDDDATLVVVRYSPSEHR